MSGQVDRFRGPRKPLSQRRCISCYATCTRVTMPRATLCLSLRSFLARFHVPFGPTIRSSPLIVHAFFGSVLFSSFPTLARYPFPYCMMRYICLLPGSPLLCFLCWILVRCTIPLFLPAVVINLQWILSRLWIGAVASMWFVRLQAWLCECKHLLVTSA